MGNIKTTDLFKTDFINNSIIFRHLRNGYGYILIFMLFIILILYSFSKTNTGLGAHDAAYWADASGYYIYLPATFIYGYHSNNYPDGIDAKMGNGFWIDRDTDKMISKYTMGLAIISIPFFLIFHILALILGFPTDGFSEIYYYMPAVTGPFFLVLAAFFLYKFLRFYVQAAPAIISIGIIIFGTNILYFTTITAYMTHVYSFAVISFLLFFVKKFIMSAYSSLKYLIYIAIALALIFLLRPVNLIIAPIIIFLDIKSFSDFKKRLKHIFSLKLLLIFLLVFILCISPQFIYWKFISGSFFYYSYGDEGFYYLKNPKILEVLFAPLNGMLLYNPVILFLIVFTLISIIKKQSNSILFFLVVVASLYLISSWGCFFYGCGYGCRPFIEFLSLFALPLAFFINGCRKWYTLATTLCVLLFCVYFNIKMITKVFSYTRCFLGDLWEKPEYIFGNSNQMHLWNWHEYGNYIDWAKIYPLSKEKYTWINNFETDFKDFFGNTNSKLLPIDDAPSGEHVTTTISEFSDGFYYIKTRKISYYTINKIDVDAEVLLSPTDNDVFLVCQQSKNGSTTFWASKDITHLAKTGAWQTIHFSFEVPYIEEDGLYSVYFWSPKKHNVLIDNMAITFHY